MWGKDGNIQRRYNYCISHVYIRLYVFDKIEEWLLVSFASISYDWIFVGCESVVVGGESVVVSGVCGGDDDEADGDVGVLSTGSISIEVSVAILWSIFMWIVLFKVKIRIFSG